MCFFFLLFTPLCQSLSPDILDIFNQNAYCCWAFDALPGPGSRPLSLFCSLCRPCSLYADRLARSAFHLLFASSCRKLTVDVHTRPALGHSVARIDRWSTGKGMGADSLSKHNLVAGLLSQSWVTTLGSAALRLQLGPLLLLPLGYDGFVWVLYRPVGNDRPEIWLLSCVPRDCFLTSKELLVWAGMMKCIFSL